LKVGGKAIGTLAFANSLSATFNCALTKTVALSGNHDVTKTVSVSVSCSGADPGKITVTWYKGNSGTYDHTFTWDNQSFSVSKKVKLSGTYTGTITAGEGNTTTIDLDKTADSYSIV